MTYIKYVRNIIRVVNIYTLFRGTNIVFNLIPNNRRPILFCVSQAKYFKYKPLRVVIYKLNYKINI